MKRIISIAVIVAVQVLLGMTYAQEVKVTDVVEMTNDMLARTSPRQDGNGNDCAVIRVDIPTVKNMQFSGKAVGDVQYSMGEYVVYVPQGTQKIPFSVEGYGSGVIDFSKYGVSIQGKSVYKVIMAINKRQPLQDRGTLTITANVDGSVVLLDGAPIGTTPFTADGIKPGKHVLSIANTLGYSMRDKTVTVRKGRNKLHLALEEKKPEEIEIDILIPGGDTAGQYWERTKRVEKNGLMGLSDFAGEIIIPCEYDEVSSSMLNGFYVVKKNNKCGLYEPGIGVVIPCIYDKIDPGWRSETHNEPVMLASRNGKWGAIDLQGNTVVPFEYTYDTSMKNGMIIVVSKMPKRREKYGVYNTDGEMIVAPKYDRIMPFSKDGYALAILSNRTGILDRTGKFNLLPSEYSCDSWYCIFEEGLAPFQKNGKWGCIDVYGNEAIPFIYEVAPSFEGGLATVCVSTPPDWRNTEYSYIDATGRTIFQTDSLHSIYRNKTFAKMSNGECYVEVSAYDSNRHVRNQKGETVAKSLCGVYDTKGNQILPIKFRYVKHSDKYFICKDDDNNYIYDEQGRLVLSFPADNKIHVEYIKDGIIQISDDGANTYGYLNMKGEVIANCVYDSGYDNTYFLNILYSEDTIADGLLILIIGDRYGFMDKEGKIVIPLNYTGAIPFKDNIGYVRKQDGTWVKVVKDNHNNIISGL